MAKLNAIHNHSGAPRIVNIFLFEFLFMILVMRNVVCLYLAGVQMVPETPVYGAWPRSGEIDIVELRGQLVKISSDLNYQAFP